MVPIRLPPPSLFSMITVWPVFSVMLWATVRANASLPVPGEYGTMILIGRFGNAACACASAGSANMAAVPTATSRRRPIRCDADDLSCIFIFVS